MMKRLFLLLALLFPALAYGQGSNYSAVILGSTGRPVGGAQITVCAAGSPGVPCSPSVNIYQNQALTIAQSNPIITDAFGNFSFWAAPSTYEYTVTGLNVVAHGPFTVVLPCIVGASCASAGGIPSTAVAFSATPSFAASFNASYAMPLTGDVTAITITGTPINGNLLRFSFQQDSTGGHIVTWPGNFAIPTTFAFKVAPNQTNRLTFLYDGTNWQMLEDIPDGALDYYVTAFSATPVFANTRSAAFDFTLTGNVTASTFSTTGRAGTIFNLNACENNTGGFTFAFPANVTNPPGFTFDTVATHCNYLTYRYNGTSWTPISTGGSGGGGSPGGISGDVQCNAGGFGACGENDNGTRLAIDRDVNPKGPNPYFDIMRYGGYFEPSNAPVTSVCSITASSTTLSCVSNSSFLTGHGVVIPKAGLLPLTRNASFPAVPTVGTVTPIGVSNGSTTYSYQFVLEDYFGGLTAAGTAGSTTTGAATLGVNTVPLTAMTRVSGLDTFTCSTNCNVTTNSQAQIAGATGGTNSTVNGTVVVNSIVDPTHFTVLANGMPDYSESFSGTLSVQACNKLFPSSLLTQESVIQRTWIYRGGTLVGVSPGQDPFYIDCGQGVSGQPAYVPSSAPGAAQAGYLATTISSGGGTTTMTLAAAAGTTATSQTVQHDNSSALIAAYTAALAAHGGVIRIPVIPGGSFNTFPFNATTNFTTVSNPTNSTVRLDFTLVSLNQPWILPTFFALNGIPQTSTSFQYGPLGYITGNSHPFILGNALSSGVHASNIKFAPTSTGQSSIVLDQRLSGGGSVGWIFDDVAPAGNRAPAIVVKGGFDFWFTGGVCNESGIAAWAGHPCVYLTNASTYLSATGTQAPGRVYIDKYNFNNGTAIQLDNAPLSNQPGTSTSGGGDIFLTRILHESNAGPTLRVAMGLGTTQAYASVFALNGVNLADQANGLHQPLLELTGSTNVQNVTIINSQGSNSQPTILGGGTASGPLCINNLLTQGCGPTPNQNINGVNSINDGGVIGATNGGSMGYLMPTPAAPLSCVVSSGGSVPIGTITYALAAADRSPISTNPFQGLTVLGPSCSVNTTSGQQTVTVTRPTLPSGASGWVPWRSGAEAQMPVSCNIPIPASTTTFVDTLSFGCGPSAPSFNTAYLAGINSGGVNAGHFYGGAYSGAQVTKTANFTFDTTNFDILGDPTGGAFTGTLPHAIAGQVWKITNVTAGANLITIQPDSGTILTPSGAASSVTLASGVSDEFTCSGTTCFLKSSNSGGSTNVTNCAQFGVATYTAAGVANTIGCAGPPVTAGLYVPIWNNPSAGATAMQVGQLGIPVNAQSGNYTIVSGDRAATIRFTGGTTATLTLPAIAFPFSANFVFRVENYNSGNLTITPTTQTINGGASLTVLPGWRADVTQDNTPNWFADLIPTFNAFSGSCTAINFNSSSGLPCAILPVVSGVNAQTTNYTAIAGDNGKIISMNGTSVTLTLPASPPAAPWGIFVENVNASSLTVSRNGLNIDGAATNITLTQNQGVWITHDGSNYFTSRGIGGAGGGSTPSEDQVTALAANRSVSQAAFTKTEAWGAATGANINLWTLKDSANNTGTGFLKSMELQSGSAMAGALRLATNPTTSQTATVLNVLSLRTLTAADSTHNYYSPGLPIIARYWTGAADADDTWTASNQCANTGANPACTLNFGHTGTTGAIGLGAPGFLSSVAGSSAAPSYSWAAHTNSGMWDNGGNPTLNAGGNAVAVFTGSLGTVPAAGGVASQCWMLTTTSTDIQLCRKGAANPTWGLASATPTAYIHNFAGSSRSGTDTNVAGATATIEPGIGTGNAALAQIVVSGPIKGSTGTAAQTVVVREAKNLQTTITTNNTAQTIMTATVASGGVAGGLLKYCVHMDNATDFQVSCGEVTYALVNKAGTITAGTMTAAVTSSALSTGTLTVTWAASAATPSNIQVTANSSITPTVMRISWSVENFSDANDISVTSN